MLWSLPRAGSPVLSKARWLACDWEAASLAAILVVGALIRLLWVRLMPVPPQSDYAVFYQMAQKIAAGVWEPKDYGWLFQGAGYPLVLAPLVTLGGDLTAIRLANVAFQLGAVLCVWTLGRRLFGRTGGLLGALFAALCPGLWLWVPLVAAENLAVLVLTATAALAPSRPGPRRLALLGLLTAALAFVRPAYVGLALLLGVAAIGSVRAALWRRLAAYALGAVVLLAPITFANQRQGGPLFPIGAASWQLWLVNNDRATGAWFDPWPGGDYPLHGLTDQQEIRAAQQKLAVQFIAANPEASLAAVLQRHNITWGSDQLGVILTAGQLTLDWPASMSIWLYRLPGAADRYYALLVALAAFAAIRYGYRRELIVPLVLPLAYMVAVLLLAEGNGRYHVPALPFVCVLAGAGVLAFQSERWWWPALGGMLVLAALWSEHVVPWLVLLMVLALVAQASYAALQHARPALGRRAARSPRLAALVGVAALLVPIGLALLVRAAGADALAARAAVDPQLWRSYHLDAANALANRPIRLEPSTTRPGVQKVSYPDSVLLAFDAPPRAGEAVGLQRTLPDLSVGETYKLYLQVFVPVAGEPGDEYRVVVNDETVWRYQPEPRQLGGWQYVYVPWTADGPNAVIRVERRASLALAAAGEPARVRDLHLYPKY